MEGGHASARCLSFDAQSAAAAARSGVPVDLMTVAARVDAGTYLCISTRDVAASPASWLVIAIVYRLRPGQACLQHVENLSTVAVRHSFGLRFPQCLHDV